MAFSFGLSIASRVFIDMLAPVLGLLRIWDIPIVGCLDDLLLREQLAQKLTSNFQLTVQVLERFSWVLNLQKLALVPTKSLKYLVIVLNMVQAKILLL